MSDKKIIIDGYRVIEEFLLTKGEQIVFDNKIVFKPLIDFGLIVYGMKVNATNRLAMKFDLEKFFMRANASVMRGSETIEVIVPKYILNNVKAINDQFREVKDQSTTQQ